ncbi:hypothetical protein BCR34DRAFT_596466 [Clohesyomyces aquaticus]|uniref:Uncharacterized protein n=1 Tax=Clohesyomyces aquaticus TaxID=1231657 RepID=A0A1Y2A6W4_9PLEO|nr:hypothetical protein BCR34DRAFT_596466 [Clohesyomyces aquaticus]
MTEFDVAEYVVASLDGTQHPALQARPGSGIVFDSKKKKWRLESQESDNEIPYEEIYRECLHSRNELLATANKYRKKLKQPMLETTTQHSWTEVETCVQTACEGLEKLAVKDKDMSGSLGKLKRGFRSLCRNAGAGQTLANLIPNDSFGFTSVLCGGIKVVFAGLRATGLYREEIYRTLEHLPYILEDHAANVRIYKEDEEIHRRAATLYVAIFDVLRHILLWFLKTTFVTGVKLLVDPLGFTDRLQDSLSEVRLAAQRFEMHATKLSRRMQDESIQLQYRATSVQDNIQSQIQTILDRQGAMEERLARATVLENLDPLLHQVYDMCRQRFEANRMNEPTPKEAVIDPEDILSLFLYEPELLLEDCNALGKALSHLSRTNIDMDRIAAMQSNSRLRALFMVDEPELLLLNGRGLSQSASETSIFSAKVVARLLEQHDALATSNDSDLAVIPMAFLCGQHRDWQRDPNGSPEEVAMSLLLQLIDRGRQHLDPVLFERCFERIKPGNIKSICSCLESLVLSLESNVFVFLLVDGLQYFAHPLERRERTKELVSRLVAIFRKQPAATLKFLFASPTKSEFVEDLFANYERVEIARDLPSLGSPMASHREATQGHTGLILNDMEEE